MIWTLEEDAILLRLEPLLSRRTVAVVMARDTDEISRRLSKLRGEHKKERTPPPPKTIEPRRCLTHGGYFTPERENLFVCRPCKSKANWRDGQWMQDTA